MPVFSSLLPLYQPSYSILASLKLIVNPLSTCFFPRFFPLTSHSLSQISLSFPEALSLPHQHHHTLFQSHIHMPISPQTPTPVFHFSFRHLSLQLQQRSRPAASCQVLGAVCVWLCYHIALPMQLSPVRTKRNPVSYWPLMFNETGV